MQLGLGRRILGTAAIAFAVIAVAWGQFNGWQQIRALGKVAHPEVLVYFAAAPQFFGGVALQFRKTARVGALALGAIYLVFALLWVPFIAAKPGVYDSWGNFFEQFSLVSGALIVYGSFTQENSQRGAWFVKVGYVCFGICVISFTLEQLFYLSGTASFVPKWIPPGQMFWAVATTVAFALAAIALLSGRVALLAAIAYGNDRWFRPAGLAPHAFCRLAQVVQLGRQCPESRNYRSRLDRC